MPPAHLFIATFGSEASGPILQSNSTYKTGSSTFIDDVRIELFKGKTGASYKTPIICWLGYIGLDFCRKPQIGGAFGPVFDPGGDAVFWVLFCRRFRRTMS